MADKYLNLQGLTKVSEYVNEKLKKVTTMPATPELNDTVLYVGNSTVDYKQGIIYIYTTIGTYYGWSDLSGNYYYTKATAPQVGDTVYSDTTGTDSGFTIGAYDATLDQVTINSLTYDRDTTGDAPINDWVAKGGTSVILNGQQAGEEANFYAPTTAGTGGQMLVSRGDGNAPEWASTSTGYAPSFLDNSLVFSYGVIPDVEGNSLIFDLDND